MVIDHWFSLQKAEEWIEKSKNEIDDPFNTYADLYIAYNILYNIKAKLDDPNISLEWRDSNRAINILDILDVDYLINTLNSNIEQFVNMVLLFKSEMWNKKNIQVELQRALIMGDNKLIIEYVLKMLYKIRCNLFHGEKGVNEIQRRLLINAIIILETITVHLKEILENKLHITD